MCFKYKKFTVVLSNNQTQHIKKLFLASSSLRDSLRRPYKGKAYQIANVLGSYMFANMMIMIKIDRKGIDKKIALKTICSAICGAL